MFFLEYYIYFLIPSLAPSLHLSLSLGFFFLGFNQNPALAIPLLFSFSLPGFHFTLSRSFYLSALDSRFTTLPQILWLIPRSI